MDEGQPNGGYAPQSSCKIPRTTPHAYMTDAEHSILSSEYRFNYNYYIQKTTHLSPQTLQYVMMISAFYPNVI
jgi:hypothetical protein